MAEDLLRGKRLMKCLNLAQTFPMFPPWQAGPTCVLAPHFSLSNSCMKIPKV